EIVLGRVGDPPHHAAEADQMHGTENQIEKNERQPEMNLAQGFVHQPAEHLGEPEIESGEAAEENVADQRVVKMRDHEVGVVNVDVHGSRAIEDAGQAAKNKHPQSADGKQHGSWKG